ncbi:MAG: DNA mismatch repair protein MutS [Bdellovibrionota bacterium]
MQSQMQFENVSSDSQSSTPKTSPASQASQTPLMKQYWEIKSTCPDAILFFRLGDFYEMFFDDAVKAAPILGIALTSRDKNAQNPVPLCGVPFHSSQSYVAKLLDAGLKVAICEQVEDASQSKGIVKREIIKVITPGLRTDEEGLAPMAQNFVLSLCVRTLPNELHEYTLGCLDYASGSIEVMTRNHIEDLMDEIDRINPVEILVFDHTDDAQWIERYAPERMSNVHQIPQWVFSQAKEEIKKHLNVMDLGMLGLDHIPHALESCAALYHYVGVENQASLAHLQLPKQHRDQRYMVLDHHTIEHLELLDRGAKSENSLFSILNQTKTSMGARRLKQWMVRPLCEREPIEQRYDAIEILIQERELRKELRVHLAHVFDVERILSRLSSKNASLRDLISLLESLQRASQIKQQLAHLPKTFFAGIEDLLDPLPALQDLLQQSLNLESDFSKHSYLIKDGYHAELDRWRNIAKGNRNWILELEQKQRKETGISSLKVGYNKVFGYYLEVTNTHRDKIPAHYIRKQTLANAERFVTPELKEKELEIENSKQEMEKLEMQLFQELRQNVSMEKDKLQTLADHLAQLDAMVSLAQVCADYAYVRPVIQDGDDLILDQGRHPVVERSLALTEPFVPNSVHFTSHGKRMILLTGPNMAGKSTVMRQVGLIVIMAQMGCFVPAEQLKFSLVDRVFTRIGASDDLAKGRSTFMMEMSEAAYILHHATPKSLILLDELGRGTSTYDGLSIAWAIMEHLDQKICAKTIFATHYHELTSLAQQSDTIENMRMTIQEWEGKIVFLRKLEMGSIQKSYGIEVARLAGMETSITQRAQQILKGLEKTSSTTSLGDLPPLSAEPEMLQPTPMEMWVDQLDPDQMSPKQALDRLYELKKIRNSSKN